MVDSQDGESEYGPEMEPLTPEEKEQFLSRVRAEGRSLTSAEQYALFGPPQVAAAPIAPPEAVAEMEAAPLSPEQFIQLEDDFFADVHSPSAATIEDFPPVSLIQGIIFDFDDTLAHLERPHAEVMEEGARNAEAYMRSTQMELPDDFWKNIIEARRFSQEKSVEEKEEHIAEDALSFLLQFYGYPASKMDPKVLRRAVDIFYASEMMAWKPNQDAIEVLKTLHGQGFKLAIVANYNDDRTFQRIVDYCGFRPYLDACITSASVEYRKPDMRIFEFLLERWDALPHEVVIVGDSLVDDIQGAAELGAFSIQTLEAITPQVAFDNEQMAEQIQPDSTAPNLSLIPKIISSWIH